MTVATLNEADRKFCPLAVDRAGSDGRCMGQLCMAWRNTGEKYQGYCGMAGKPSQIVFTEMRAAAVFTKEILEGGQV